MHHYLVAGLIIGIAAAFGGFLDALNTMANNFETGGGRPRGCIIMIAGIVVALLCLGGLVFG